VTDEQNYERTNGAPIRPAPRSRRATSAALHYGVRRLIEQHGRDGKITRQMPDWPD